MNEETYELKLYSPITGHLMEDDQDDFDAAYYDYEGTPLSQHEMAAFEEVVRYAVEQEKLPDKAERGLMEYYWGEPASLNEKVISAFVDVEKHQHALYGVLKCTLKEPLNQEEIDRLKEYATGQYSDGWGESLEQHGQKTDWGDLYIHFWNSSDDFFIITAHDFMEEPDQVRIPAKKKTGHPGRDAR